MMGKKLSLRTGIVYFDNRYVCSTDGTVERKNYRIDGSISSYSQVEINVSTVSDRKYLTVNLLDIKNKPRMFYIHDLIIKANYPQLAHISDYDIIDYITFIDNNSCNCKLDNMIFTGMVEMYLPIAEKLERIQLLCSKYGKESSNSLYDLHELTGLSIGTIESILDRSKYGLFSMPHHFPLDRKKMTKYDFDKLKEKMKNFIYINESSKNEVTKMENTNESIMSNGDDELSYYPIKSNHNTTKPGKYAVIDDGRKVLSRLMHLTNTTRPYQLRKFFGYSEFFTTELAADRIAEYRVKDIYNRFGFNPHYVTKGLSTPYSKVVYADDPMYEMPQIIKNNKRHNKNEILKIINHPSVKKIIQSYFTTEENIHKKWLIFDSHDSCTKFVNNIQSSIDMKISVFERTIGLGSGTMSKPIRNANKLNLSSFIYFSIYSKLPLDALFNVLEIEKFKNYITSYHTDIDDIDSTTSSQTELSVQISQKHAEQPIIEDSDVHKNNVHHCQCTIKCNGPASITTVADDLISMATLANKNEDSTVITKTKKDILLELYRDLKCGIDTKKNHTDHVLYQLMSVIQERLLDELID